MPEGDPTHEVLRVWDTIAPEWERHRDRLFQRHRVASEWMIDRVDLQAGQTILELAAGPGETGFHVAARVGPAGRVISTDLAPTMVEAARRGAKARQLTNVDCRIMDAQRIELPDASVDGVMCRFGVMLVPDPALALREARRVLRPGGRLAYVVFGPPERNPWIVLFGMALREHGHPPSGDAYGSGGAFSLSAPERNRELVVASGFTDLGVEELASSMRFETIDDYWDFNSTVAGSAALMIRTLPEEEKHRLRSGLEPLLMPFRSADGFELPSLDIGVWAAKPAE